MPTFAIPSHNRALYLSRIEKSLQYINLHLAEALDLERVAAESNFSPFHFHRVFSALMNESLQNYIIRLRMERAANLVVKSPSFSLTEVAMQCGYSSSSNFARSFKNHFGCTASAYARQNRKSERPYPWISVELPSDARSSFPLPGISVRNMPALHLAYFSSRHGYETASVKQVWLTLFQWAAARGIDVSTQRLIAFSSDDPEITPPSKCRYLACLTIPGEISADSRATIWDFPEHLCAVAHLSCDAGEYLPAYRALYRDWLPDSGFVLVDLPPYEIYYNAPEVDPASKYEFDLCVPVASL